MSRRELVGLVLVSLALWLVLGSISSAIADSLPGREAQRRWLFAAMGFGDVSLIGLDQVSERSFRPGCSTYLAVLLGFSGFVLWMSGAGGRRRAQVLVRQRSDWSGEALSRVINNVTRAASIGEEELERAIDEARRSVLPYLAAPYRWIFDRSLENVDAADPAPGWTRKRRWARWVAEAILVLAAVMVGMASITGVGLATFDELPELGMPLGPSAAFQGVAVWLSSAAAWTFAAFALLRLDRRVARAEENLIGARRNDMLQLEEELSAAWSSLVEAAPSGSCGHRTVRAFAAALLEAMHPDDRHRLLPLCQQLGFESERLARAAARPSLAARDAWAVATELSSLLLLHGAALVGAAFSYLAGRWANIPLGWFRAPTTRHEEVYSSPLGAAIVGVPFLLAIVLLLGVAWVLGRSAERA